MRVVMFGFQTWGHRTLQALLDSAHDVVMVITHPVGEGAYEKVWADSVAELAEAHGVPVLLRERPDDEELYEALKQVAPDVIVATNWRTWIPPRKPARRCAPSRRAPRSKHCGTWWPRGSE
jgi:methionyl-tRNA formyltransferase